MIQSLCEVITLDKINDILKTRRIELKLSMRDVAEAVGVSEGTISRWESGNIANMKRDKIVSLAKALQVSPSVIMGWEDMPFVRLSKKEEKMVLKYRENPQMQTAVDKLLGIE